MLTPRLFTAALALGTLVSKSQSEAGPSVAGNFLSIIPGASVEYLVVIGSQQRTAGNLEVITVSKSAPDGQVRTQMSAVSDGETLAFGSRVARPSGDGYIVTSTNSDGSISQRRLVRSSVEKINAAVVALSTSVNRKRVASDRQAVIAQLRTYRAMSAEDAGRLTKAQISVAAAAAALNGAQSAADRLSAIAREARAVANAKIDESGVSLAQNESREAAMKAAAEADENSDAAQRQADLAGLALAVAKSDAEAIRAHLAMVAQRAHDLATQATSGDTVGR